MDEKRLETLREFFSRDRYAFFSGFRIESADNGEAVCSCVITEKHLNANGSVMGGALFALGDFTFAVASNAEAVLGSGDSITVAVNNSIQYLHGMREGTILAHAVPLKRGRKVAFYRIDITDSEGTMLAEMSCTGYR